MFIFTLKKTAAWWSGQHKLKSEVKKTWRATTKEGMKKFVWGQGCPAGYYQRARTKTIIAPDPHEHNHIPNVNSARGTQNQSNAPDPHKYKPHVHTVHTTQEHKCCIAHLTLSSWPTQIWYVWHSVWPAQGPIHTHFQAYTDYLLQISLTNNRGKQSLLINISAGSGPMSMTSRDAGEVKIFSPFLLFLTNISIRFNCFKKSVYSFLIGFTTQSHLAYRKSTRYQMNQSKQTV